MDDASELISSRTAWQAKEGSERASSGHHLFAMPEKFCLKLSDIESPGDVDNDSELFVIDQSKALQDENDRLRKLVAERDFDLTILKKKWQEERVTYSAGGSMASDVAASKIVELSRKLRDITVELERERTKNKQLTMTVQEIKGAATQSKVVDEVSEKTYIQGFTMNTVQSAGYRNNSKVDSPTMHGPSSAPLLRPSGEGVKRVAWRSAESSFPSAAVLNDRDPCMEEESEQTNSELEDVKLMCQEYRLVAQATQVEKEKLLELVAVLNKRLETSTCHALQADQRIQELQQKNVQLEKQLGRASLELHPRGGANRKGGKSFPSVSVSLEDQKQSVQALKEQNIILRQALEEKDRAREEDLRIYQDIIEKTRLTFTEGLRQLRS